MPECNPVQKSKNPKSKIKISNQLSRNRQLSHQIRRNIQERIRTGDFFLLVSESLADRVPLGVALWTDDVLVAVAFEVDHVAVLLQLVELDVDENPDAVGDSRDGVLLRKRGRAGCGLFLGGDFLVW